MGFDDNYMRGKSPMAKEETHKSPRIIEVFMVEGKKYLFGMRDDVIRKVAVEDGRFGARVNIMNNSDRRERSNKDVSILQNSLALPRGRQTVRGIV